MKVTKEWLQDLWTDTIGDYTENTDHINHDEVMNMLTSLKQQINKASIEDRDEEWDEEYDQDAIDEEETNESEK